jgi:hypothetical protein
MRSIRPLYFLQLGMNNEDSRECEVGKRITSLIRSIGQGPTKRITGAELQTLKTAAGRLDQMLKVAADADRQILRNAAARIDQLLISIRTGKDVGNDFKRRKSPK